MTFFTDEFIEGYEAYGAEKTVSDNPYISGMIPSLEEEQWGAGWFFANNEYLLHRQLLEKGL